MLRLTRLSDSQNIAELSNPYKALLSYKLEDLPCFYGRKSAIKVMIGKDSWSRPAGE